MQLETVGEIVRTLRARRGMEQVELARACGWRDASAVSRIETDRIRPTRRTLVKLADSLGTGERGVPRREEVRSWLFLAAGIPPTPDEIAALGPAFPTIETWTSPAVLMDFTWVVWRANEGFSEMMGLPRNYTGRHYLAMIFDPSGTIRGRFGDRWNQVARTALQLFRRDTERRSGERWYRKLMARLDDLPDFKPLWATATAIAPAVLEGLDVQDIDRGRFGLIRLQVTAEPRLFLFHVLPEDGHGVRAVRGTDAVGA